DVIEPSKKAILINTNKEWVKAVNTKELMSKIDSRSSGLEFDIYFDSSKKIFDVHHDVNASIGLNLDDLLKIYNDRKLEASIWIDFKNLNNYNCSPALNELIRLRNRYNLKNKILIESYRIDLLEQYTDSAFFTSYYTPYFNPYLIDQDSMKSVIRQLATVIKKSKVSALSGYYFQYPFLHKYFPQFPILIWSPNDRWSLMNRIYKAKIKNSKEIFISLY
ncbi:MAG: hypothetical protein ACKVOM_07325, partial [Ferruginibacter sp.]